MSHLGSKYYIFHPCTCTDIRLLTVNSKHPKVMRINQVCKLIDRDLVNQLQVNDSIDYLEEALRHAPTTVHKAFMRTGGFVQAIENF